MEVDKSIREPNDFTPEKNKKTVKGNNERTIEAAAVSDNEVLDNCDDPVPNDSKFTVIFITISYTYTRQK